MTTRPGRVRLARLTDLAALGAGAALRPTRGDGHTIATEDIRLFETEF